MERDGPEQRLQLVSPAARWQAAFLAMARECEAVGEHRYELALRDFAGYVRKAEATHRGDNLPERWVPTAELWLEHDSEIVGCVRLRLALNPFLEREGGHVGYDIRPSRRRRGYGTALLRLALTQARALGMDRVLVTCDDDNIGSAKVIERNGGVLAGRCSSEQSGKPVRQYWIE